MRIANYINASLGVSSAIPTSTPRSVLPSKQLSYIPATLQAVGPVVKRALPLHCNENDEDTAFFEPTLNNWYKSRAGELYNQFARNLTKSSNWDLDERESEPQLFALEMLGLEGFDCGISNNGCMLLPTCDEVLTKLRDKEKAQWVWFVLRSMHHLTHINAVVNEQTVVSQLNLEALAEAAAHTFYWKYDESVAHKCEVLAGLVNAAIASAFVVLGALLPNPAPAVAGGALPITKAESAASSTFLARKGPKLAQFALDFGSNIPDDTSSYLPEVKAAGDAIQKAVCSHFANGPAGLETKARLQIKSDMVRFYHDYRRLVQDASGDIIRGVNHNCIATTLPVSKGLGFSTLLASVLRSGHYLTFTQEQQKRFDREPHYIEGDLTQYYKNALVSTSLKGQMCYIKCTPTKPKKWDASIFEPSKGKFCYTRCWQNWNSEKELRMFGLDEITKPDNDWRIEINAFLQASYDHYNTNGLRASSARFPSVQDLFNGNVTSTSGSYLPVCDTQLSHRKGMPDRMSGIPCMCGDSYGDKTTKFWEEANFDSWTATHQTGDKAIKKIPAYVCKNDMAINREPPVTYFLNLCNMGWRWPNKKDPKDPEGFLLKGADNLCREFKSAVDDFQLKRSEAPDPNCYMCTINPIGKRVRDRQYDTIRNLYRNSPGDASKQYYNFREACTHYQKRTKAC
ncbi:MAG: hypothetical protein Q9224_003217 [Gallowayella concinna]